jgi:hypothetical protein
MLLLLLYPSHILRSVGSNCIYVSVLSTVGRIVLSQFWWCMPTVMGQIRSYKQNYFSIFLKIGHSGSYAQDTKL